MYSQLEHMMVYIEVHQKFQLKDLHVVLYSLTQLVKFLYIFGCTISIFDIEIFVIFLSLSLHNQMDGAIHG